MAKKCISFVTAKLSGDVSFTKNTTFTLKLSYDIKIFNGCLDENLVSGTSNGIKIDLFDPDPYGSNPKFPNESRGGFVVTITEKKVCAQECCGPVSITSDSFSKEIQANSTSGIDINEISDSVYKWLLLNVFTPFGVDSFTLQTITLLFVSAFNFEKGWIADKSSQKEVDSRLEQLAIKLHAGLKLYSNCSDALRTCSCNEISYDSTYKHPSIISLETTYPEIAVNKTIITDNVTVI